MKDHSIIEEKSCYGDDKLAGGSINTERSVQKKPEITGTHLGPGSSFY